MLLKGMEVLIAFKATKVKEEAVAVRVRCDVLENGTMKFEVNRKLIHSSFVEIENEFRSSG